MSDRTDLAAAEAESRALKAQREQQKTVSILRMLADGISQRDICRALHVSPERVAAVRAGGGR